MCPGERAFRCFTPIIAACVVYILQTCQRLYLVACMQCASANPAGLMHNGSQSIMPSQMEDDRGNKEDPPHVDAVQKSKIKLMAPWNKK